MQPSSNTILQTLHLTPTNPLSLIRMHRYFIKTPWIAKKIFFNYIWSLPATGRDIYLSFDDGPHPEITPWVLDLLAQYEAKASFFCIGNNVALYPEVYKRIINEGHAVGNHTYHHLNGWKTSEAAYISDVKQAAQLIDSKLFRPPYGKIRSLQAKNLLNVLGADTRIVMWDVLSGDFDRAFTSQQCYENVIRNIAPGSIVVFHDSEKAFPHLKIVLPRVLEFLKEANYSMKKIDL